MLDLFTPLGSSSENAQHISEYLARCQVDTPEEIVRLVWTHVNARRRNAGDVVDFGCGDARFSKHGNYRSYRGFEIDSSRGPKDRTSANVSIDFGCAFQSSIASTYDTCVGNPPYVRHHDLTETWRSEKEAFLEKLTSYSGDGRSNAYIYFLWLALASVKDDGLVAIVIPFEWVSRPASGKIRAFIKSQGWSVDVYRIEGAVFDRVLTTACITVIDKKKKGEWRLFRTTPDGECSLLREATGSQLPHLRYESAEKGLKARRGVSPGGQEVFLLTEQERLHYRLKIGTDVVPAVSSFRYLESLQKSLTLHLFREHFVHGGLRCWLIKTDTDISLALKAYLNGVTPAAHDNYTCNIREIWWSFKIPKIADILYASGFKGTKPKIFKNDVGAVHVGGIHGIYCEPKRQVEMVFTQISAVNFSSQVVGLSNGFLKIEVNQMNAVLNSINPMGISA